MNLALTVGEIVAPVFLLGALGYFWVKLGFEYPLEFVTRIGMSLAVPALVFVSLMQSDIPTTGIIDVAVASILAYLAVSALLLMVIFVAGLDLRTYLSPLIFGNTGNIGLPLALFAFGETGLGYAVVIFATMAVYNFTVGVWLVSGGGSVAKLIREPLVSATLLGALFLWQGWETPKFLTNTLDLVGQLAIPLMLITLGVAVARLSPKGVLSAVLLSLVKAVASVSCAWLVGRWMGLDPVAFGVLVLQLGTPVAVTSYLLAAKYGADADAVAGLVVVSTILGIGLMPLLLGLVL